MDADKLKECLELLRKADNLLMANGEIELAVHLSLVIEKLALRLPDPAAASSR